MQSRTFRTSDGVIFLTHYAQLATNKVVNLREKKMALVAHGVNQRFRVEPRMQHGIDEFSDDNPFRILYVSTVDVYKHQWFVIEAVALLRRRGFPVSLDMVGHAYAPALERLNNALEKVDPNGKFINYVGALPYETLHKMYAQANLCVFASSCETFGQIVTEAMSAGLPIACSKLSAMSELLGDAALYFDPECPASIALAIQQLIDSKALRMEKATKAFERVQQYSWKRCADETFAFLNSTFRDYKTRTAE
jgi:glycosyltransferase involved in cell wall biosynthesis